MARLKKGNWTPKEDRILLKVKKGNTTRLQALATEWGRDYKNLYNHFVYLKEKDDEVGEAMVFTIDTSVTTPKRSDSAEIIRMKKGLDLVLPNLEVNGGSIPIPNKLAGAAKRYLDEVYNKNKYTYSRQREGGKETGFTRIFRRR